MAVFELTPKVKLMPGIKSWDIVSGNIPVLEQDNDHVTSLRKLESEFGVRMRFDSIDIHKNTWPSQLMQTVYNHSYPLRNLLRSKTTVKVNREWLGYWEVYSRTIIPGLTQRLNRRINAARESAMQRARERKEDYKEQPVNLRGIPVRTFHVCDNRASSVTTMQKAINKVEFETGAQINWDWLATYTSKIDSTERLEVLKNKERWSPGVDGEGGISTANMRAWKNKIATALKVADMIIINSGNEDEQPAGIAFTIMNLAAGGSAVIRISRIANTAIISMIHIFTQCFETSRLIHTVADDRMYLCGEGFLDNISSKYQKMLYEYCDIYPGSLSSSPFAREYLASDQFLETVDHLMDVNVKIQGWRYDYYEKLLKMYSKLHKSSAGKTFDDYVENALDEAYRDQSDRWAAATGFNFFLREE